ncbi:MAG: carbohydrate kinase [Cyanobacteria bacterium QS_8_64_29]|nr:MAG: carbohydrate kinase [Cyanobacteria bacterium QS_8_64_29]
MVLALGIDFGTSGARVIALDASGCVRAERQRSLAQADAPAAWRATLFALVGDLPAPVRAELGAIAIDGTSGTVLLCDARGEPLAGPLLYDDRRAAPAVEAIQAAAPPQHVAATATSSLAKLCWWQQQGWARQATYLLHQADWLAALLHGQWGISDYHNALKLGYDVAALRYPDWLASLSPWELLPQVVAPGTPVAPLDPAVADRLGCPRACQVCAGTTDSIAAFLASGARLPGEGITSLGSTLALKLLSEQRVEDARYGIYSHRLGDLWLTGGASNVGGAVLRHYFSDAELAQYSARIDPAQESPLDYYPLLSPGERFPVNDPDKEPQLEPQPADPVAFLHGLLESLARIEASGYRKLQALGASPLARVYTAGGGAQNPQWRAIRQRQLGVPVAPSQHAQAAYGAARLAQQGAGIPQPAD